MTVPAAPAASAALAYALPAVSESPRDVLPTAATPAVPRAHRGFLPAQPTEAVRTVSTTPAGTAAAVTPELAPTAVVSPMAAEPRRDRDEAPTEREPDLPLAALANAVATAEPAPQAATAGAPHVAATAAVPSRETDEPDPVTHLRLRLAPPLLGEVLLDVRHDNGAVTAHAVVSLPATEHVLRQVQTQVQQLLADQGLQARAFDITCAFAGAGNGGGGSHLPQPFSVPSGAWAARPKVPDSSPPEAPQGPPPGWSRIVDIIA